MRSDGAERGFSLLEVVVGLTIVMVIMGSAFFLLNRFQLTYRHEEANAEAQRNGRFAIARLNEIIRSAGTNPTGNAAVNNIRFVELGTNGTSIRLKSDLNGDGQTITSIDDNRDVIVTSEDVTLSLSDNSIIMTDRTGAAPPNREAVTIADNITNLTFSDPDGSRRQILVNITAVPTGVIPSDPNYREVSFSSLIRLRNR